METSQIFERQKTTTCSRSTITKQINSASSIVEDAEPPVVKEQVITKITKYIEQTPMTPITTIPNVYVIKVYNQSTESVGVAIAVSLN